MARDSRTELSRRTSSGESGAEHAAESHGEAGVTILGVDTESLALSVLAVVASLVLAFAVWFRRWTRPVPLAVAGFGLVFAAGDIRELVHQLTSPTPAWRRSPRS
jgi:hypothetical protein